MCRRASIALPLAAGLLLQACGNSPSRLQEDAAGESALSHGPRTVGELAARAAAKPPILFIGLDGADWQQLEPLVAQGAMPHLARLRADSAWGELESEMPALSPLLWTSMLTGVSPLEHGILDFSRFAPGSGVREPIGSEDRRAPAIWNAFTWAGKRVAVLGLWATHPAEPVDGVVVSDRLFGFLNVEAGPPPGAIYPSERAGWARAKLVEVERAADYAAVREYLPWLAEAEYRAHAGAARAYDHPISALRRILIETRLYGGMAESLLAGDASGGAAAAPDLTLVYLQGTDSIGHVFAPFAPPRLPTIPLRDYEHYRDVPQRYFQEVDRLLGRLLALADRRQASVVVASDHGFLWHEGRPERWASSATQTAARWHRQQGIWLVRAAGVAPGRSDAGRLRQVFPTLLTLAGLPAAPAGEPRPLAGLALPAQPAFDYAAAFRELAARRVPADSDADHSGGGSQFQQEEMAKLQALGYIGASEATRADPSVLAAGGPDATRTASSWNNAGLVLRGEHREAEARAAFERALALEPELASAQWNLSELLFAGGTGGESERADELLVGALAGGLPDGTQQVIARAIAHERVGAVARSLALLDRAIAARPEAADLWLFRGRYRVQSGDCRNAVADLIRAGELAPANSDVFATAALAQLCAGDHAAALVALRRAIDLAPEEPRLRALLAELQRAP